ncbi:hypothetical protein SAMN05216241_102226 [Limimonas halophila]|uniref:Uncharacterized protein n=1 Tax=Limimonas halophila TaxID=1082479 RepID=A0A1G7NMC1_9PROT|nr:hypothetical protein [Limimonas halophila]SDF75208.1 hypothetical protein SAMN05216241_102226 [Limimonas halophila]
MAAVPSLVQLRRWIGSFARGSAGRRVVGIVGNDGAVFVRFARGRLANRIYVPAADAQGVQELHAFLHEDPKAPVSILLDVLEQHYREAQLPRLNPLDRRKILARKLRQTFEAGTITSHVRLARPALSNEGGGRGQETHMLVGLPDTEELRTWTDAVAGARNPVAGLSLLPMEAHRLVRAVMTTSAAQAVWEVLVLRHRASGYRQLVFYNGELVFTRLTPNQEADADVADEVDTIEGEFRSTMSYLRRLSFTDADRLELVVVVPEEVGEQLNARRMRIREVRTLSPAQFADALGLDGRQYAEDAFTDSLVADWFARQRWPELHLEPPPLRRARLISMAPKPIAAATAAALIAGLVYDGMLVLDLRHRTGALADARAENQRRTATLQDLDRKLAERDVRLPRFIATVRGRAALARTTPMYADQLRGLAQALPTGMIVTDLQFQVAAEANEPLVERAAATVGRNPTRPPRGELAVNEAGQGALTATVRLRQPPADRRAIMRRYRELTRRLTQRLPGYAVALREPPFETDESGQLAGSAGLTSTNGAGAPTDVTGTYVVTGPDQ